MKDINEFIKKLVKIEYVHRSGSYGLYPFQMYVETYDKKNQLEALDLGGDVKTCYNIVMKRLREKSNRIYLALDFPSFMDMDNDFIAIMSIENNTFNLLAIPYDRETGEQFEIRRKGKFLNALSSEIKREINFN